MTIDDVLNYFGSGYAMHKSIGISASNVKNWLSYGYIPIQTQIKIQRLTKGNLKINESDLQKEIDEQKKGMRQKKKKNDEYSQNRYKELFAEQNGLCDICKQSEKTIDYRSGKIISLAFDHDHTTGKARGLLCGNCNRMLGFCKDNIEILENSLIYIKKHKKD